MAIALVANVAIPGAPNGGTSSGIDTTGATLLVIHVADGDSAATTVSDSKGNTWTALTTRQNSVESQLYYCASPTVGTGHTFTTSATSAFPAGQVLAFSGVDATPFDVQNGNTAFDSTIATGSVTPAEDGSVIVAGVAHVRGVTPSIGSSFTITDSNALSGGTYYGAGAAYLIQTTASAVNPTWTLDSSGSLAATIAVFAPSTSSSDTGAITPAAGSSTTSTIAGASSAAATPSAAAGAATAATMGGASAAAASITPATGASTAATLVGVAGAGSSITPAAGAATASTMAGASSAAASITAAAGGSTASTLTGVAGSSGSVITPAAGTSTTATLVGSSTAAASITPAQGQATAAILASSGGQIIVQDAGGGHGRPARRTIRAEELTRESQQREEEELIMIVTAIYASGMLQ